MSLPSSPKIYTPILCVLICMGLLLAACGVPALTYCEVRGEKYVQLYAQPFGSERPGDWLFEGAWETINKSNENWALYTDGKGQALYTNGDWGEQPFSFSFKILTLKNYLEVDFLHPTQGILQKISYYSLLIEQNTDSKDQSSAVRLSLSREPYHPEYPKAVSSKWLDFKPDQTYMVEIAYNQGKIQVYFEPFVSKTSGEKGPVLTFTDPTPLPAGTIEFQTYEKSTIMLDDLRVCGKPYKFSGRVLNADTGEPVTGVSVSVYGSTKSYQNGWTGGKALSSSLTGSKGEYEIDAPEGYGFFQVHMADQAAYQVSYAESKYGQVYDSVWIEYISPPVEATNNQDIFYVKQIPTTAPAATTRLAFYTFYGQVWYEVEAKAAEGIEVTIYGAAAPYPDSSYPIKTDQTNADGYYKIDVDAGAQYYFVMAAPPQGYRVSNSISKVGTTQPNFWIEHPAHPGDMINNPDIFYLTSIPPTAESAMRQAGYTFTGQVLRLEDKLPVSGERVTLYGADDKYPDPGKEINFTITDDGGYYTLTTYDKFSVYSVEVSGLPGEQQVITAESKTGYRREDNRIEYTDVFGSNQYYDALFYVQLFPTITPIPPPSETPTPVPTDTPIPAPSDTPLPAPIDTLTPAPTETPLPAASPVPALVTEPPAARPIRTRTIFSPQPSGTPPPAEKTTPGIGNLFTTPAEGGSTTEDGPSGFYLLLIILLSLVIGGLAALLVAGYLLGWNKPPASVGQPPEKPPHHPAPLPPILPPLRLIDLWLSESGADTSAIIKPQQELVVNREYRLHVQLRLRGERRQPQPGSVGVPVPLSVVLFAPKGDLAIPEGAVRLDLPPTDSSEILVRAIRPLRPGRLQVRACVYFGNLLVQSAVLAMPVGRRDSQGITCHIDYVASGHFSDLDQIAQPSLAIFTNQAADGTHWLGVFSNSLPEGSKLRNGDLQQFPADYLNRLAERARQALARIQGEQIYRQKHSLPLDERALQAHSRDLVDLACEGTFLYNDLFGSDQEGTRGRERVDALRQLLNQPGLVSIARCRRDSLSMPWGMLYSLPLLVDAPLQICPIYQAQLRANEWQVDRAEIQRKFDLLDDPQSCQRQDGCPRKGGNSFQTVCPFGFLGFTHQIEQPIQLIQPTPSDQTLPRIMEGRLDTLTRILYKPGEPVRVGMGVYTGFRDLQSHRLELEHLSPAVHLDYAEDHEQVWDLLQKGGQHIYYFFCHGVEDENHTFKLLVGQPKKPGSISASSLTPSILKWPPEPHPLVVLNGCETVALKAEVVGGFIYNLHLLGALGVVGTEIKVKSDLAKAFGLPWMRQILSGLPTGQAMLNVRRELERQGNPLGLVYSLYAPTGLHLHAVRGCLVCSHVARPDKKNNLSTG